MAIDVGFVAMVKPEAIIISDRAREVMGDLDSLETNMEQSGLITPLAVMDNQDGTYQLLAGERRFTILSRNNVDSIPVRVYSPDLSEIQIKTIEKSENFFRKDMEYWELDKLTMEIHKMQQELHGVKAPGPGHDGWSVEDTGDMIGGVSKASVSQAITRAEAREAFPELFENCKTQSDATKVLKQVDEAIVKQAIVQKLESQKSNGLLEQLSNCFIVKDFFEGVKEIPAGSMHLVEIDPPYAISIKEAKKTEGVSQYSLSGYNEIPADKYQMFLSKVFQECYRVMTDNSWLLCWFAPEPWFNIVHYEINNAGFETTRMCPVWTKPSGQTKRPEMYLPNSYEMFFYAWKGRPAIAKQRSGNTFNYSPVPANQKVHETERPIDLMKDIYETFAFPGSRILIPFLGSGSGLIAAHELGMSPVGFELGKGYKDSFLVRVNAMKSV